MPSISFKLKYFDDPYVIEFEKIDNETLGSMTRILDIEGYKNPLTIDLSVELYWQVGDLLLSNHWLFIPTQKEENEYRIKLNGFDLIFKRKINE